MTPRERLFDPSHAFDHPVTRGIVIGAGALLVAAPLVTLALSAAGVLAKERRDGILRTWRTWLILAPLMIGPVLLGAAWVIGGVALLSLVCLREYARATGFFRERLVYVVAALSILVVSFAVLDHWYALFMAAFPLATVLVAAAALLGDRPKGYLQRVGLGVLGVMLFGAGLGHFAWFANDAQFRPLLLWLLVAVEMNDVMAFVAGRIAGHRKLCPQTSPNKTVAGAVGALLGTTGLVLLIGPHLFEGTPLAAPVHLVALGAIVSVAGQFGDLTLSAIKRDLGIKDMAALLPGHGGLLDRFDSLLLAAPAVFHYVGYFRPGIGLDQAARIVTGP